MHLTQASAKNVLAAFRDSLVKSRRHKRLAPFSTGTILIEEEENSDEEGFVVVCSSRSCD
jgi:hypothetical protein